MATVVGTFSHCGQGQRAQIEFVCEGPSCNTLAGFDKSSCETNGSKLVCNNGVTCAGKPPMVTDFEFFQAADSLLVSEKDQMHIGDCEVLEITSDGTEGNAMAKRVDKDCGSDGDTNESSTATEGSRTADTTILKTSVHAPSLSTTTATSTPLVSAAPVSAGSLTAPAPFKGLRLWFVVLIYGLGLFGAAFGAAASVTDEGDDEVTLEVKRPNDLYDPAALEARATTDSKVLETVIDDWGALFAYWLDNDMQGKLDFDVDPDHPIRSVFQKPLQQVCEVAIVGATLEGPTVACIAATTAALGVVSPPVALLYRFSGSMFCNYLIGKIADLVTEKLDTSSVGEDAREICSDITNLFFSCSDDLSTDAENCGSCGRRCESDVCKLGACVSSDSSTFSMVPGSSTSRVPASIETSSSSIKLSVSALESSAPTRSSRASASSSSAKSSQTSASSSSTKPSQTPASSSSTKPSQASTSSSSTKPSQTSASSSSAQSSQPTSLVEKSGWKFSFGQSDQLNAWLKEADYFLPLTPGGKLSVNTRCLTIEEVTFEGMTKQISPGTPMVWETKLDPAPPITKADSCCIRLSGGSSCETGGSVKFLEDCNGFQKEATFAIKSLQVYGCTGLYVVKEY